MVTMGRRASLVSVVGVVLCVAAACGRGGDRQGTPSGSVTERTPATPAPTTTVTETARTSYDREAFCTAWEDVKEGSDVPADQGLAVVRRVELLGPPSIASDLELWADYFERVMPLVDELHQQDPSVTSERRAQLEEEIESMSAPIRESMARIRAAVESECPSTASSLPRETSSPSASAAPGSVTTAEIAAVVDCLRDQGVDVAMPSGRGNPRGGASQPFDPAVAAAAWRACRHLYVPLARDVPGATGAQQLALLDCMADKGWIQAFMGPVADLSALEADRVSCVATAPG